jgi:hypothetical protein
VTFPFRFVRFGPRQVQEQPINPTIQLSDQIVDVLLSVADAFEFETLCGVHSATLASTGRRRELIIGS